MLPKRPPIKKPPEPPSVAPPPVELVPDVPAPVETQPVQPAAVEPIHGRAHAEEAIQATQPGQPAAVEHKSLPKTNPPAYINQRPPTQMISNYRKRQQAGPFIIWGLTALLIVGGLIILVIWLFSKGSPLQALLATDTPTATLTFTPTSTSTATSTPTETPTPTVTLTPTASAPFAYEIQSGDTLYGLQAKFGLSDDFLCTIAALNPGIDVNIVAPGQKITLPNPGLLCPTATPIDLNTLSRGKEVEYTIQAGDTLASIASFFNSTAEDIIAKNKITDANSIFVGQVITVRANLVTPTMTSAPTITPGATLTPGAPEAQGTPTLTPTP